MSITQYPSGVFRKSGPGFYCQLDPAGGPGISRVGYVVGKYFAPLGQALVDIPMVLGGPAPEHLGNALLAFFSSGGKMPMDISRPSTLHDDMIDAGLDPEQQYRQIKLFELRFTINTDQAGGQNLLVRVAKYFGLRDLGRWAYLGDPYSGPNNALPADLAESESTWKIDYEAAAPFHPYQGRYCSYENLRELVAHFFPDPAERAAYVYETDTWLRRKRAATLLPEQIEDLITWSPSPA